LFDALGASAIVILFSFWPGWHVRRPARQWPRHSKASRGNQSLISRPPLKGVCRNSYS
jgi:hypothetical protein